MNEIKLYACTLQPSKYAQCAYQIKILAKTEDNIKVDFNLCGPKQDEMTLERRSLGEFANTCPYQAEIIIKEKV